MGYTSNVKQAKNSIDDWQDKALNAIGKFIRGEAVRRCKVGAYNKGGFAGSGKVGGNLRGSIDSRVEKNAAIIGTPVEYAIYVEKGTGEFAANGRKSSWVYKDDMGVWHRTKGMKAQPFLTPAAEGNINKIDEIVKQVKFKYGVK